MARHYQYMRVIRPCLSEGINALAQFPKMLNIPSRHALCLVCFKNPSVSSHTWLTRLKCTMRVHKNEGENPTPFIFGRESIFNKLKHTRSAKNGGSRYSHMWMMPRTCSGDSSSSYVTMSVTCIKRAALSSKTATLRRMWRPNNQTQKLFIMKTAVKLPVNAIGTAQTQNSARRAGGKIIKGLHQTVKVSLTTN